jgi:UDP-glucose 4-epimerase
MNGVVITGGTSMLGIALINECIKHSTPVLAIIRKDSKNLYRIPVSDLVQVIECNLEDVSKLQILKGNYDVFYHFAWEHTGRTSRDNPVVQNLNIIHTLDAVELAYRMGCGTFIGAGSQAEYGRVESTITPDTPTNPETAYGIAKYSAGKLSGLLCRDLNIRHIWTRVFSVYGPYDNNDTMIMYSIKNMLENKKPIYTKCEQLWDYLYCEDAARAFYKVGLSGKDKAIYCIGSGKVQRLYDYIYRIRDSIDCELYVDIGGKEYSMNQVMHLCADITNLTSDTGFQPVVSFSEGIIKTINWYKGNAMCEKHDTIL